MSNGLADAFNNPIRKKFENVHGMDDGWYEWNDAAGWIMVDNDSMTINGNKVATVKDPRPMANPADFTDDDFENWVANIDELFEDEPTQEIKCECGAIKANTTHTEWCPRFIPM